MTALVLVPAGDVPRRSVGERLADVLRRYYDVTPTTGRFLTLAGYGDLHREMVTALILAADLPGYFTKEQRAVLARGYGAALTWWAQIDAGQARWEVTAAVGELTPWLFASLLGHMVDAGVTDPVRGAQYLQDLGVALRSGEPLTVILGRPITRDDSTSG